uniref:DUF4219 domain-containing protein n=1 Tax=Oryza brachyantha TaxID=4533 RepID=J3LC34_ORYBR
MGSLRKWVHITSSRKFRTDSSIVVKTTSCKNPSDVAASTRSTTSLVVMARDKSPVGTPQGGGSGGGSSGDGGSGVHGGAMVAACKVVSMHYPMLSDTNYDLWAVKMKLILRHLRAWGAVTVRFGPRN